MDFDFRSVGSRGLKLLLAHGFARLLAQQGLHLHASSPCGMLPQHYAFFALRRAASCNKSLVPIIDRPVEIPLLRPMLASERSYNREATSGMN